MIQNLSNRFTEIQNVLVISPLTIDELIFLWTQVQKMFADSMQR